LGDPKSAGNEKKKLGLCWEKKKPNVATKKIPDQRGENRDRLRWGRCVAMPPHHSSPLVGWEADFAGFKPRHIIILILFFFQFLFGGESREGETERTVAQVIRECPAQGNYSLTVAVLISLGI